MRKRLVFGYGYPKAGGAQFRRLCRKCGLSQEALALKAEIACNYMSGLERGVRNPMVLSLDRVAHVLGVSISDIVAISFGRDAAPKTCLAGRHVGSRLARGRRQPYTRLKKKEKTGNQCANLWLCCTTEMAALGVGRVVALFGARPPPRQAVNCLRSAMAMTEATGTLQRTTAYILPGNSSYCRGCQGAKQP